VNFLRQQGLTRVQNLKGGIVAWINEVDPSMSLY
jgi:rhodanese-related sulfurtransferase